MTELKFFSSLQSFGKWWLQFVEYIAVAGALQFVVDKSGNKIVSYFWYFTLLVLTTYCALSIFLALIPIFDRPTRSNFSKGLIIVVAFILSSFGAYGMICVVDTVVLEIGRAH